MTVTAATNRATGNSIPQELIDRRQWVVWRNVQRGTETAKLPFQPSGKAAKSNDSETWTSFEIANRAWACGQRWDGVGFVFCADDGLLGIDLDGCRNSQTGDVAAWAREIIERFNSYSEISPSQTGVKLFLKAEWPFDRGRKCELSEPAVSSKRPGIEVYAERRYFCVTGQRLDEVSANVEERQEALNWLIGKYFPDKAAGNGRAQNNGRAGGDVLDRARKYIERVPGAVSGQRGHDVTFRAACVLVCDFALSPDTAFGLLAEWNTTCEPPWTEAELRHKLADAEKQPGERGRLRDAEPQRRRSRGRGVDPESNGQPADPLSVQRVEGRTDLANARRFVRLHGENVHFCHPWKKWLTWDGARWATDETGAVLRLAKNVADAVWQEARANASDAALRFAARTASSAGVQSMLTLAASEVPILPNDLDQNEWLLNSPTARLTCGPVICASIGEKT